MISDGVQTKRLRKLQRNCCYLCGERFETPFPAGTPDRRRRNREGFPTLDHVRPRSAGYGLHRNKLLAHQRCNEQKGARAPWPCELLYLEGVLMRGLEARPTRSVS